LLALTDADDVGKFVYMLSQMIFGRGKDRSLRNARYKHSGSCTQVANSALAMSAPDISTYLNRALLWDCLYPKLTRLCAFRLVAEDDPWAEDPEFLIEVVVSKYERRKSQTDTVNAMPLYPTEAILWDENQVPKVHYTGKRPFPVSATAPRPAPCQKQHCGLMLRGII